MIPVNLHECEAYERSGLRPDGYAALIRRRAASVSDGVVYLADDVYTAIKAETQSRGYAARPAQPIPADFDPQREARRMKQGGCCGQASEPK